MSFRWPMLAADVSLEQRLEFARLPGGWAAVAAVAALGGLLYVVFFLYRREQRAGVSLRRRMGLAALRALTITLLACVWLEPVRAAYIHRRVEALTLVLLDSSASMGLHDRYPNTADAQRVRRALGDTGAGLPAELTREEVIEAALSRDGGRVLRELAGRNTVRVFGFDEKLTPAEQGGAGHRERGGDGLNVNGRGSPRAVLGPATDIGRAVRQAVESQGGAPIAGVVVVSDGRFNRGEPAEVVARYARGKKIPIVTVGVGDPSPPRNLTLAAVEAPPNVFVKDPFKITAHLRAEGLDGASVNVELVERPVGTTSQPAAAETRQVSVGPGGKIEPIVFQRRLDAAKETRFMTRVAPVEGETLTDDNQQEVVVRALENKMRVLLAAGGPTWEYQYLSRLLQRDATFNVSTWLQSADENAIREGTTLIDHFPREQEELFEYDCIVLLDPQAGDFDPAWTANLEQLVSSQGGGLLYVAGRINGPRFVHESGTRELLDMLPVVIDANESDLMLNELGHFQTTAWPFLLPPQTAGHPVLALGDTPAENTAVWNSLPGVYWHYPVRREKPAASVLLRHSNPRMRNSFGGHVLLATQFYGSGRTAFMGFDSTWRWRRYGERYFNRFWVQLLRNLVEGKLLSGQQRGLIQFERDRYSVGEAVVVEARLLDTRHLPLQQAEVPAAASVGRSAAKPVVLKPQENRAGWYRGQFVASELGTHTVRIALRGGEGAAPSVIQAEVRVGRPELEFQRPELDRESLELLAGQSAGGKYLDIDELDQLPRLIPSKATSLIITGQRTPLWDRWWTLATLVVILGVEWWARKRWHLL